MPIRQLRMPAPVCRADARCVLSSVRCAPAAAVPAAGCCRSSGPCPPVAQIACQGRRWAVWRRHTGGSKGAQAPLAYCHTQRVWLVG